MRAGVIYLDVRCKTELLRCPLWLGDNTRKYFLSANIFVTSASIALRPARPPPPSYTPSRFVTPILRHQTAHLASLVTTTSTVDPSFTCLTKRKLSGQSYILPFISYFAVKLPARKNMLPAENFYIWNMFAGAKMYLQGHAFDHKDGACQNLCLISEAL